MPYSPKRPEETEPKRGGVEDRQAWDIQLLDGPGHAEFFGCDNAATVSLVVLNP